MCNKNLMIKTPALLLALLIVMGCPQEADPKKEPVPVPIPDILVTSVSIAGTAVTPLPQPAASIDEAAAVPVVVNTERPPTESESADGVYYRPVQPIVVTLANENQTAFFNVTAPDETPAAIELPGTQQDKNITRNIGITLPNDDNFQIGQVVWIRVVAADESKMEFYKFEVINQTHDTAISSITISGHDVLDTNQSGHIGPWLCGSGWTDAATGLVNLTHSEAGNVTVAAIPRNNLSDRAKPVFAYAKIPADASGAVEPAAWDAAAPASFANHDILAVKVTASNGKALGYLKITVNVGGSPFLSSLTVNGNAVSLGNPGADIAAVGGAYRVEEGQTLTASPVTWAVTPAAEDSSAAVTWTLAAKGTIPQDGDFTSPTSFDTSHNYLYIKVVSGSGEFTMYYLVVYDERPRDTEHIKTGFKNVPVYRFTIPNGHTWAEMGDYPTIRIKILQEEEEFNISDGYQRHFVFGELSNMEVPHNDAPNPDWALNTETLYIRPGGGDFNFYMPFLLNRRARDLAIDTPAPNIWYTVEWPMNDPPDWTPPWDPNASKPAIISGYEKEKWWPDGAATGDVYFGIGITHDSMREYWIKELSLVSEDGSLQIICDLLGNGRIDSNNQKTGFVETDPNGKDGSPTINFLRELVSDPTLK